MPALALPRLPRVSQAPKASTVDRLASLYLDGAAAVPTDRELSLLAQWIDAQYRAIPCQVRYVPYDVDLPAMLQHLATSGDLVISTAFNHHPFLGYWQNAQFRAVHDWHHVVAGADSSFDGELAAYQQATSTAPNEIWWILFSEIALQAAVAIATGEFAAQKLVRLF